MVPFYGQGMNAGLEDVRVLFDHLDQHGVYSPSACDRSKLVETALDAYTAHRTPDAHMINDLALMNYEEMSSDVRSPLYKLRKWMEESVSVWIPWLGWRTQYTRVSFENQRYSELDREVRRQGKALIGGFVIGTAGIAALGLLAARRYGVGRYI